MSFTVKLQPRQISVEPALNVAISPKFDAEDSVLIASWGSIRCGDREIARMSASDASTSNAQHWAGSDILMVAPLSRRALEMIETSRERTQKRDVALRIWWTRRTLACRPMSLGVNMYDMAVPNTRDRLPFLVAVPPGQYQRPDATAAHVLIRGPNQQLLYLSDVTETYDALIPGSEWVHDYAPVFGLGRSTVYEIPKPEVLTTQDVGADAVNAALDAFAKAEGKRLSGEWLEMCRDLRGVFEILRNRKADFSTYLTADGWDADAIAAFDKSMDGHFNVVSKFVHKTDRGNQVKPDIIPCAEDALHLYGIAAGALNLVAKKVARQRGT